MISACQMLLAFNAQLLIPPVDGSGVKKEQEGEAVHETFERSEKKALGVEVEAAHRLEN